MMVGMYWLSTNKLCQVASVPVEGVRHSQHGQNDRLGQEHIDSLFLGRHTSVLVPG